MKIIKDHDLIVSSQKLEMNCQMKLGVRLSIMAQVREAFSEIHSINIVE
jgi:hypothetical protein